MNKPFSTVHPSDNERAKIEADEQSYVLQFQKEKTALKFYMLGREYYTGLKALGFLEKYSAGKKRKDGKTPEMHHMVRIAFAVTQLRGLRDEEMCIVLALLHDLLEDEDVTCEMIAELFGKIVADKTWKLTKKFGGAVKNKTEFMMALADDPDASIVKGLDRNDNFEHMDGVFKSSKKRSYCAEGETLFLKMLHTAAKNFPDQQIAYHAIRYRMKQGIRVGRATASYEDQINDLKETLILCQEDNVKLRDELNLTAKKLRSSYALTNSGTYEEHKNRVESMVSTLTSTIKQENLEAPDGLTRLEKKLKVDLFNQFQEAIGSGVNPRKALLEALGLSLYDISNNKHLYIEPSYLSR